MNDMKTRLITLESNLNKINVATVNEKTKHLCSIINKAYILRAGLTLKIYESLVVIS